MDTIPDTRKFLAYLPIPLNSNQDQDLLNVYKLRLVFIKDDLEWLLKQSYQVFINQLINDIELQRLIDSFLKYSLRPYESNKLNKLPEDIKNNYLLIQKYILLIVIRIYYKPNEGFNLKNNVNLNILDLPKIFDLCCIYNGNKIVTQLINSLFQANDKLNKEFKNISIDIKNSIESIIYELDQIEDEEQEEDDNRIISNDILVYLFDISFTINCFIKIQLNMIFNLIEIDLITSILKILDIILLKISPNKLLELTKYELTSLLFNLLAIYSESITYDQQTTEVETFIHLFSQLTNHSKLFNYLIDNFDLSKFKDLIDKLKDKLAFKAECNQILNKLDSQTVNRTEEKPKEMPQDEQLDDFSYLKEMFPSYTDKFFKDCLNYFGSLEQLVNNLLENNIPEFLKETNIKTIESKLEAVSLQDTRKNIYDGDEFDLRQITNETITSKVHMGKRDKELIDLKPFISSSGYNDYIYEDEYDDTYDSNMNDFKGDKHDEDENDVSPFEMRPFNEKLSQKKSDSYRREYEENNEATRQRSRMNFIENPEEVRRRQQEMYNRKHGYRQSSTNESQPQQQQQQQQQQRDHKTQKSNQKYREQRRNLAFKKMNNY